jgi:Protein of unknown function (DUF1091)
MTIMTYKRSGKDYLPVTAIETTLNFCDMTELLNNKVLKIFAGSVLKQLQAIVHPCPYEDELKFDGFEVDGTVIPDLLGRKSLKTMIKFSRGMTVPIFTVTLYGNSKTRL